MEDSTSRGFVISRWLVLALTALTVAGCGSAAATPRPGATASPSMSAAPTARSARLTTAEVSSLMLTATEVTSTAGAGVTLTQVKDGLANGRERSDDREFSDGGRSIFIDVRLYALNSAADAAAEYPQLRDSLMQIFSRDVRPLSAQLDAASQLDEWTGGLNGKAGIAMTFQQGAFLCSIFAESFVGVVNTNETEGLGALLSRKISALPES